MSSENGFINLRLNQEGDAAGHESFWPSFTDILTVIVMIFLIALVVLLMRNIDLVQQLRNTMEAERMAAELARTTGEEKESLAIRLINTENQLSELRMQLMKLDEVRTNQLAIIKENMRQISELSSLRDELDMNNTRLNRENTRLQQQSSQLETEKSQLDKRLQLTDEELAQARQQVASLQVQNNATESQLTRIKQAYSEQKRELDEALGKIEVSSEALALLQGDYDSLKVKYDKLVRPARTAVGKYVVEVRYTKTDNQHRIAMKTPDQERFSPLSREELDRRLSALKQEHENALYIKVIFPENSGLSYNEAWEFTSGLHKKYDYYFQDD